ncbi:hypothetical protein [Burkholderia gladioli]|uniref:hypothetical protein n=1 Tax=Burkholderia gladioli TaxID=28095 RepID=UPI00164091A1|nr:hypothetical protein [Burkholderia gladioli]
MVSKVSKASVRDRLTKTGYSSGEILFDGTRIGRFVSYGKGSGRGNVGSRTVYGSRIYQGAVSIEAEAATTRVLLDKVAAELARAINAGKWPSPAIARAKAAESAALASGSDAPLDVS